MTKEEAKITNLFHPIKPERGKKLKLEKAKRKGGEKKKEATLALSFLFNEKTYLTEGVYFDVFL